MKFLFLFLALAGCGWSNPTPDEAATPRTRTLVIGAYTTPRELLDERILPSFRDHWRSRTGEDVVFETSFQGSGSQSRAVAGGFEADVVWLSLEPDVQRLVDAGLVTHDWKAGPTGGMASSSVAVIGVRPGNPKGITAWTDLARTDVEVLTPNVRTSGGAMWNVLALVGAAERPTPPRDPVAALAGVLANVRVMDKGARESMLSFEKGVGDAVVTYENEAVVARKAGKKMDYVLPTPTVVIENPVAVVDAYAARHGTEELARAFVNFLTEPAQQAAMSEYGLRPVVPGTPDGDLPPLPATFTVGDLGGWTAVKERVFAEGALYDQALAAAREAR